MHIHRWKILEKKQFIENKGRKEFLGKKGERKTRKGKR